MRSEQIQGIGKAQQLTREVILEVARGVRPYDTERVVAGRIEHALERAGVHRFLHTGYAWWGDRTRFARFHVWEADALPTERRLQPGEPFILDVAPLVDGWPADFAFSGVAGDAEPPPAHAELLKELEQIKRDLVRWAREAPTGGDICALVDTSMRANGREVVHTRYPAGVLGHSFEGFPNALGNVPRIGSGFQIPLVGNIALAIGAHHLLGKPYPFLNEGAPGKPQGLYAVEPHLAQGEVGAKFESVLLIDGDETRWLDPGLFGEVSP